MSGDDAYWDESPKVYPENILEHMKAVQEDALVQLMEEMGFTDHYIDHSIGVFRSQFNE